LVQGLFDFVLTDELPERIIGDNAYDSDALDEALAEYSVEMIAPHRGNRKLENKTQDGRPLRRYKRRWTVDRTISWFQNYRRLCIRWEESTRLFQGMLHFFCSMLLIKQVLG
jgi:transposase